MRARIWRGRDFRKKIHIDLLVLYPLQSTVVKKPRAQGSEGDAFGENGALSLRIWGCQGVGFAPFTTLPLWRGSASLSLSLKYKGSLELQPGGMGWGEGVSVRGRVCTRGRSGQSYAEPLGTATLPSFGRILSTGSHARGAPFGPGGARCLHALRASPEAQALPVCLCTSACVPGDRFV